MGTVKVMEKLLTSCSHLVSIDLSDVKLQAGILRLISQCCHRLQKLSISRCTDVNAEQLLDFCQLNTLSHVNLYGYVGEDTLNLITKRRPDIFLNHETFSSIGRPVSTLSFKG